MREVLEKASNYNDALKILTETNVNSPIYYIIGGITGNEAAVVEKDREGVHALYTLEDDKWFLV